MSASEPEYYLVDGELQCSCSYQPNNHFLLYYEKENIIAMCMNCYKTYKIIAEKQEKESLRMEVSKNGVRIKSAIRQNRRKN